MKNLIAKLAGKVIFKYWDKKVKRLEKKLNKFVSINDVPQFREAKMMFYLNLITMSNTPVRCMKYNKVLFKDVFGGFKHVEADTAEKEYDIK